MQQPQQPQQPQATLPPAAGHGHAAAGRDPGNGHAAAATGADHLVSLEGVTVRYASRHGLLRRRHDIVAIDEIDLSIRCGETLGLVGATGSGKSTTAQIVMGMLKPNAGSVRIAGTDLWQGDGENRLTIQRLVQVVMQDPYSSLDPRMTVGDIIAEPLTLGRPVRGEGRRIDTRVAELLAQVGLPPGRAASYPHQFSGGQRQRIAIARALAPKPQLIVLDEATSALDVSVRAQILTLLKSLQEELKITYLVISHDLVTVAYLASEVAVMYRGRIVERGPTAALFRSPRHPYTLELLASVPGHRESVLAPLPTPANAPAFPAEACRYADRCALRARLGDPARCIEEDPPLAPVGDNHHAACHFSGELTRFIGEAHYPATAIRAGNT